MGGFSQKVPPPPCIGPVCSPRCWAAHAVPTLGHAPAWAAGSALSPRLMPRAGPRCPRCWANQESVAVGAARPIWLRRPCSIYGEISNLVYKVNLYDQYKFVKLSKNRETSFVSLLKSGYTY